MSWAFSSHGNLSLFLRIFKLVSQRKQNTLVVRPIGKSAGGVALENEGYKCRVDDTEGEIMWRLADIEVSSAKTEVFDSKREKI